MARRLPVYLLLDCSESMAGPAIEAVSTCVGAMLSQLRTDPQALETAFLSVITFAREAKQIIPLTELMDFQLPPLKVRTGTSLGAALRHLSRCLKTDVVRTTETTKGDYKPLVFLLTDGQPTDDWEPAAEALARQNNPRIANIIAVGMGADVDDVLYRITETVLLMPKSTLIAMRKLFVWMSASVAMTSQRLDSGSTTNAINLPSLPADCVEVASRSSRPRGREPQQVFLHALCARTHRPYLMRFGRSERGAKYEAIAAHPLEEFEKGDAGLLPSINSSLLRGCPGCPYCKNPQAAVCGCGALFCDSSAQSGPSGLPRLRSAPDQPE